MNNEILNKNHKDWSKAKKKESRKNRQYKIEERKRKQETMYEIMKKFNYKAGEENENKMDMK